MYEFHTKPIIWAQKEMRYMINIYFIVNSVVSISIPFNIWYLQQFSLIKGRSGICSLQAEGNTQIKTTVSTVHRKHSTALSLCIIGIDLSCLIFSNVANLITIKNRHPGEHAYQAFYLWPYLKFYICLPSNWGTVKYSYSNATPIRSKKA